MIYPVDLTLLEQTVHMPGVSQLERSMNRPDLRLHDFCIPINLYFPTPELFDNLRIGLGDTLRYYPSDNRTISRVLGDYLDLNAENIVAANGSTELITWICERLITEAVATDVPTFGRWTDNPRELGRRVHTFPRLASNEFRLNVDEFVRFAREHKASAIAVCNPNNPTGAFLGRSEVLYLLDETSDAELVVIDESFIDFACQQEIPSVARDVIERDNVVLIKSLGKSLGLHGIRCGYAIANRKLANRIRSVLPPWNVNGLAEALIRATNDSRDDFELARQRTIRDSQEFGRRLSRIPNLTTYPTNANFIYCQVANTIPGRELRNTLLQQSGCFVRECGSKIGSSSQFFRIATRPPDQQKLLTSAIQRVMTEMQGRSRRGRPGLSGNTWTPTSHPAT